MQCVCLYVLVSNSLYPSQTGWSALLGAVYMGDDEIVLRLLEAGARPDIQDKVYCIVVYSMVMSNKIGFTHSKVGLQALLGQTKNYTTVFVEC